MYKAKSAKSSIVVIILIAFFQFLLGTCHAANSKVAGDVAATISSKYPDNSAQVHDHIIHENIVLHVPASYPTIWQAQLWLSDKIVSNNATVTIQVGAGTYDMGNHEIVGHRDGDRIEIVGAEPIGDILKASDFTSTGFDTKNRKNDAKINEAMLRKKFPTVLQFLNTGVSVGSNSIRLKNLLLLGSGQGTGITTSGAGQIESGAGGAITATRVSVHGFGVGYMTSHGGSIRAQPSTSTGNVISGYRTEYGGSISAVNSLSIGNGAVGYQTYFGGSIKASSTKAIANMHFGYRTDFNGSIYAANAVADGNGLVGIIAYFGGTIFSFNSVSKNNYQIGYQTSFGGSIQAEKTKSFNNGTYGFLTNYGGAINAANSYAQGHKFDYYSIGDGFIYAIGYTGNSTFSPDNKIGNDKGFVKTR